MGYVLKKDVAENIRKKYRNTYIKEKLGLSECYISLILNRRKEIPKHAAYSFTKILDSEKEIDDMFERR